MEIKLLKHQASFLESRNTYTGLVSGFGGGKSHAGVIKTVVRKLEMPGIDCAYYLPTYPLIKDIAFPRFSEILEDIGVEFRINETDKNIITPYGRIILRSMDNPRYIVGYETGYSLIDEADILPIDKMRDVFKKIISRNRAKIKNVHGKNSVDMVSTPEGFKFLHEFFVINDSEKKTLIRAKTDDNPFLPDDYIQNLRDDYSAQQIEAYLNGEFVNLTSGSVYPDYDVNDNNTDRNVKATDKLHIGMDFNITKMCAVVHVMDGNDLFAVDEFIDYFDTNEICTAIKAKYPNHKVNIYPDSSGKSRNTAGKSDIEIIKSFKFNVLSLSKNPLVRDRINVMNKALRSGYSVNRSMCPVYSNSLMKIAYKNGEPDKSSGLDHVTDAGGYAVYYIIGDKKPKRKKTGRVKNQW